jgi:hypothetical protein
MLLVFERNNAGLKKLFQVLSEQTSDSFAFLNAMCLLKYVLYCEQHFSFFMFRSGLARVDCRSIRKVKVTLCLYSLHLLLSESRFPLYVTTSHNPGQSSARNTDIYSVLLTIL